MKKTKIFIELGVLLTLFLFSATAWSEELASPFEDPSALLEQTGPNINTLVKPGESTAHTFALSLLPMPQWVNPQYPEAEAETTTARHQSVQVLPVPFGGYQDTYGILLGAAVALYDPQTQTRLTTSFLSNLNGYERYKARFQWRRPNEWLLDVSASVGTDIQHYYGEGDNTPDFFQSFLSDLSFATVSYQYALHDNFYLGPSIEYLYRTWNNMTPPPNYSNESEFRIGAQATWDYRDDVLEPHEGTYYQVGLFTLPSNGNTGLGVDVWQLEGDARDYMKIFDKVVLASRANFAWTMAGQPSYSFEYTLGGTSELRGFNSNRFRGLDFYALQEEVRVSVFDWLIASTGVDVGDITSTAFTNWPVASWQVGLRSDFAEPVGVIFRIDIGFSYSGDVFIYSINEPF